MAKKQDLQATCDSLGIKYQDNDTVEQLELMIAGKQSADKVAGYEEAIGAKDARIEELEAQLEAQEGAIAELSAKLDESVLSQRTGGAVTVKVDGKLVLLNFKTIFHKGKKYTAEQVKDKPEIVKDLLAIKSSLVQRI